MPPQAGGSPQYFTDNMVASLRTALLVCAALGASSVAPAQAGPTPEPLLPENSTQVASVVIPTQLPAVGDELSPETTVPDADDNESTPDTNASAVTPNSGEDLPTMVADLRSADPGSRQLECLAAGIYFESKSEPLAGQLAVGQVIANRVSSGRFADSYCGVLFQRGQFSFIHGHSWPAVRRSGEQWQTAVAIAKIVDEKLKQSSVADALYFHARRVHPGWHMTRVAAIGNHVFFR